MNYNNEQEIKDLVLQIFSRVYSKITPMFKAYRSKIREISIMKKPDNTLLTEADIAIQKTIIDILNESGLPANIIAEEKVDYKEFNHSHEYTWVIDPIDGTAQFVNPDSVEFCTAICLLKSGRPIAASVIIPEAPLQNNPLHLTCISTKKLFLANGNEFLPSAKSSNYLSITKSKNTQPYAFENGLKHKYEIKGKATSQTLDLLRTAMDLSCFHLGPHFNLFYRKNQKIWDGAPGICFNIAMGNLAIDANSKSVIPYDSLLLREQSPTSDVVIVAKESFLKKNMEGKQLWI